MYDQNFRNQAVKECVNGQPLQGTARKYGISSSALRSWIREYKKMMATMSGITEEDNREAGIQLGEAAKESMVQLRSVNVNIDGHDVTISKEDIMRLMEMFRQFDR